MAEKKVTTMILNVDLQCSKCYKKVKKLLCKFPEIRDQKYDEKANKVTITVVSYSPEKIRDKLCCKACGCIKSIEIIEPAPAKGQAPPKNPAPVPPKNPDAAPPKPKPKDPVKVSVDVQVQGFFYCKFCSGRPWDPCSCGGQGPCSCGWPGPCFCGGKVCGCITSIEIKPPPPPPPTKPSPPPLPPPPKPAEPRRPPEVEPGPTVVVEPSRPQPVTDNDEKLRYPAPASPVIGFWCSEGSSPSGMPGNPCCLGGPVQYVAGKPIYDSWGGGQCDYFSEENQQSCSIM